jgi:hypothetical protein
METGKCGKNRVTNSITLRVIRKTPKIQTHNQSLSRKVSPVPAVLLSQHHYNSGALRDKFLY